MSQISWFRNSRFSVDECASATGQNMQQTKKKWDSKTHKKNVTAIKCIVDLKTTSEKVFCNSLWQLAVLGIFSIEGEHTHKLHLRWAEREKNNRKTNDRVTEKATNTITIIYCRVITATTYVLHVINSLTLFSNFEKIQFAIGNNRQPKKAMKNERRNKRQRNMCELRFFTFRQIPCFFSSVTEIFSHWQVVISIWNCFLHFFPMNELTEMQLAYRLLLDCVPFFDIMKSFQFGRIIHLTKNCCRWVVAMLRKSSAEMFMSFSIIWRAL